MNTKTNLETAAYLRRCVPSQGILGPFFTDLAERLDRASLNEQDTTSTAQGGETRKERDAALFNRPAFNTWRGDCGHLWVKSFDKDEPCPTCAAEAQLAERTAERDEARRRATPVALGPGKRREAAKKLLCDICACSAETDPESLDLPHVIEGCIEPLETLIYERDACLYLSQQAAKYAGRDGHDILDAIAEKAAAEARAQTSEAQATRMREALELAEDVLSRSPFSTQMWPNGMHPNAGIEIIRSALSETRPTNPDEPAGRDGSVGGEG